MSRPFSLTMFLTFSSVKFLSEFIRIAFFCLINFCNLLGRQNLAEFIIIFLANIQYLTTLRKLILDLLFYFRICQYRFGSRGCFRIIVPGPFPAVHHPTFA